MTQGPNHSRFSEKSPEQGEANGTMFGGRQGAHLVWQDEAKVEKNKEGNY